MKDNRKKYYYYYESSLKEDIDNCHKITKYKDRETMIFVGASFAGLCLYGLLKLQGFGDLESTYPTMGLYLSAYLEGLYTYNKYNKSRNNVTELAGMIDDNESSKVYDLLLNSEISTTRCETRANGEPVRHLKKVEYEHNGEVLVSQENNEVYDNHGNKYVETGLYSYPKALRKIIK